MRLFFIYLVVIAVPNKRGGYSNKLKYALCLVWNLFIEFFRFNFYLVFTSVLVLQFSTESHRIR